MKILFILIIIITLPITIAFFMKFPVFSKSLGDANGWLGYWGGYLGALIGAFTVYLVTTIQLKVQKELHEISLKEQREAQKKSFEKQSYLQLESIKESTRLSDLRQRELIVANMEIEKIESIVQELIILNSLNSRRYNIIRSYNYYNSLSKVDSNQYAEIKDEYLKEETDVREEIRIVSAKIKSAALFANLDNELNEFRVYQTEILELFYELIVSDVKTKEEFDAVLDEHTDLTMVNINKAINICKTNLDRKIIDFKNSRQE